MNSSRPDAEQLVELETRLAYQERAIDDLSTELLAQHKAMTELRRQLEYINAWLQGLREQGQLPGPPAAGTRRKSDE